MTRRCSHRPAVAALLVLSLVLAASAASPARAQRAPPASAALPIRPVRDGSSRTPGEGPTARLLGVTRPPAALPLEQQVAQMSADMQEIRYLLRVLVTQMGVSLPVDPRTGRLILPRPGQPILGAQGRAPAVLEGASAGLPGASALGIATVRGPPVAAPRPMLERLNQVESGLGQISEVQSALTTIQATLTEARQERDLARLLGRAGELRLLIESSAHSSSPQLGHPEIILYFYVADYPDHYRPALEYTAELQSAVEQLVSVRDRLAPRQLQALDDIIRWGRSSRIVKGLATLGPVDAVLR